jgi:hypothetical protein
MGIGRGVQMSMYIQCGLTRKNFLSWGGCCETLDMIRESDNLAVPWEQLEVVAWV